ncbi:pH-response regulator protein palH/rim-21 [Sordaria brevicollis]|uniref:PH-response regulator protein palH/rim-21 n=1 Tax=Sordaria brevicollis TaxID=83679 RepID=A0AAE0PK24_SORBR|nr:pH-response regulator protein palH/rim-21 [Sordaria brevicollis]
MEPRRRFSDATAEPTSTDEAVNNALNCASYNLPEGGIIQLSNGDIITLGAAAAFKPPSCGSLEIRSVPNIIVSAGGGGGGLGGAAVGGNMGLKADDESHISDFRDPFYASTFPQCYALSATTIIAYTLVIMLFITPRSFLDGGVVVLGRKGFTNGGGGTSIGGRPWLQKVAALSVAISLTIANAATFRVAERQYSWGYQNAQQLQEDVLGGTELKIIRIISNTFLWLAQAQTLIRLFPRQREKVIIKWTAFALITLDVIFQSLNSFKYGGSDLTRPKFTEAVPALSYLFALALGVLYAAWVLYYSIMKKRYAFYHPLMKNMILVAALSVVSILVPVVFFILDISNPDFAGWGDYVRWVGAAAASVIVWEWVERIEALEREEKKDGILGREVFDGDEMLEASHSEHAWPKRRRQGSGGSDSQDTESGGGEKSGGSSHSRLGVWPKISNLTLKHRTESAGRNESNQGSSPAPDTANDDERPRFIPPPLWPARPTPAATPVSRTDTTSAASTIYAVRYNTMTEPSTYGTPPPTNNMGHLSRSESRGSSRHGDYGNTSPGSAPAPDARSAQNSHAGTETLSTGSRWHALAPATSSRDFVPRSEPRGSKMQRDENSRWDFRARVEEFAATQAEKLREKLRPTLDTHNLPVTVIPAPPRRGAALAQLREDEELNLSRDVTTTDRDESRNSNSSRTVLGREETQLQEQPPAVPASSFSPPPRATSSSMSTSQMSRPRLSPIVTQGSFTSNNRYNHLPVTVIPAPPRTDSAPREAGPATPRAPSQPQSPSTVALGKQPARSDSNMTSPP